MVLWCRGGNHYSSYGIGYVSQSPEHADHPSVTVVTGFTGPETFT
jgi:hypothetical protein